MNPANKWLLGTVSAAVLSATAMLEGTKYYAYYDTGGVPTVCQGYTGTKDDKIVFGKKYSPEECHIYTTTQLKVHGDGVLGCIKRPMQQYQYDAFTLMAYNVGVTGFCTSRAARLFNAGETAAACRAMAWGPKNEPVWAYDNGKFLQGLHKRRKYEAAMCMGDPNAKF